MRIVCVRVCTCAGISLHGIYTAKSVLFVIAFTTGRFWFSHSFLFPFSFFFLSLLCCDSSLLSYRRVPSSVFSFPVYLSLLSSCFSLFSSPLLLSLAFFLFTYCSRYPLPLFSDPPSAAGLRVLPCVYSDVCTRVHVWSMHLYVCSSIEGLEWVPLAHPIAGSSHAQQASHHLKNGPKSYFASCGSDCNTMIYHFADIV